MPKKTKEEIVRSKERERLSILKRGPDLDRYLERKRTLVSYAQGAHMYSLNYYSFVKLAKEAGANIRIKKNVIVDLSIIEDYLENKCKDDKGEKTHVERKIKES